jgi:RNA polymerase sigma-70 factor (family 1)
LSNTGLNTEQELLQQIANGDTTAFEKLFLKYKDPVYSFAFHFTRNESAAEEIVQEIFLRIWLRREALPGIERPEAWIYTLTRNLSFDFLRKTATEEAFKNGWSQQTPHFTTTQEEIELRQYKSFIHEAVQQLPPQQKQVYQLAKEKGLKYEEVAEQLGLSPNTVKSHLGTAMKSIRRYLEQHMGDAMILIILYGLK